MDPSQMAAQAQKGQEQLKQQEEQRKSVLKQIFDEKAQIRLGTIRVVKPDKVRAVEDRFLKMAQSGQLQNQISEGSLIAALEEMDAQQQTKVKVVRKGGHNWDDDSDDNDDDLL